MPLAIADRPDVLQDDEIECYRYIREWSTFTIIIINFFIKTYCTYRANWIKVHGIKYKKACVLCVGIDSNDLPLFAKVLDVYVLQQDNPVAYVQLYQSEGFNTHYHCYTIRPVSKFKIISLDYQEHPFPLQMRTLPTGVLAVVPKYHIFRTVQSCYC